MNNFEQRFIIEKDAKNTAYAFILSSGLLQQFTEFVNGLDTAQDPHTLAEQALVSNYPELQPKYKGVESDTFTTNHLIDTIR